MMILNSGVYGRSTVPMALIASVDHYMVKPLVMVTAWIACRRGAVNCLVAAVDQVRQMPELVAKETRVAASQGPCRGRNESHLFWLELQAHHCPPITSINRF
jgi:hypothetical protein